MTEFMYESLPNLMTNFCLIGTDRLNVFLIQDDVGVKDAFLGGGNAVENP